MTSLELDGRRWLLTRLGRAMAVLVAPKLLSVPVYAQWATGSGGTISYAGGNVGVGTSSPTAQLEVMSASPNLLELSDNQGNYMLFYGNGYNNIDAWGAAFRLYSGNNGFQFRTQNADPAMVILASGYVGIGTSTPGNPLSVNGTVQAKEVLVNTGWSDYVFAPDYRLQPLSEVAKYVQEHHHLPNIPSEAEVAEKGVSLGEMQSKLLAKIEEITLHMIQAEERGDRLEKQNRELEERLQRLELRGDERSGAPKN
jgi:hypothetical protein